MGETRRDRMRAATIREISETARALLVEQGPGAVTLRAIAREMGMTAPALYRYFGSHEELLRHVVGDIFNEISDELDAGIRAAPDGDMSTKFLAAARIFRRWSLGHPGEFALLFGAPLPGFGAEGAHDFAEECARRFGWTFMALFIELWQKRRFPVPADDEIDPGLREQLRAYRDGTYGGVPLPLGVVQRFLECWTRLLGGVSLEAFRHLDFALADAEPMFELMLADQADLLGLTYSPPA
ncbi:TetR/AcrR family transcriptional regulator [Actinomadura parmotrematis]|uniref:TetR/AcrR family transcriptional regulator n=1 Tax=Actinomadura parmotrematis TaxID=2864039 RepID=UPI0027E2F2A4|nr:TetR/AcrR family transcriptional regulator [Actinomadura parmotrematis]